MLDFFANQKRKTILEGWAPKLNRESEQRVRLDFAIPFAGESLQGIPEFVAPAFEEMNQQGSASSCTMLETQLEGVTLETYPTPGAARDRLIAAATLIKFRLERDKDGGLMLRFNTTVPAASLKSWVWQNHGATMWVRYDATQAKLSMAGGAEEGEAPLFGSLKNDEEDEEEESEEEQIERDHQAAVREIPTVAAKRGPGRPRGSGKGKGAGR